MHFFFSITSLGFVGIGISNFILLEAFPFETPLAKEDSKSNKDFVNFAKIPCGRSNGRRSHGRIVGGTEVLPAEFPWTVSILDESGIHFCGGFVINEKFILTAAHCFIYYLHGAIGDENLYQMSILVGANNLTDLGESISTLSNLGRVASDQSQRQKEEYIQKMRIQRIIFHPKFSHFYPDFENDIALIQLQNEIEWTAFAQPVCLSDGKIDKELEMGNGAIGAIGASVAGWGLHDDQQNEEEWMKQVTLKKVTGLPIWPNAECRKAYKNIGIEWNTKESHVCAGFRDGQGDACRGDSGAALLVEQKDFKKPTAGGGGAVDNYYSWTAIGLVSGGEGCSRGFPGIYTRISYFIPWINQSIADLKE